MTHIRKWHCSEKKSTRKMYRKPTERIRKDKRQTWKRPENLVGMYKKLKERVWGD